MSKIFNDIWLQLDFKQSKDLKIKAGPQHMIMANKNEVLIIDLNEKAIASWFKSLKEGEIVDVGVVGEYFYFVQVIKRMSQVTVWRFDNLGFLVEIELESKVLASASYSKDDN